MDVSLFQDKNIRFIMRRICVVLVLIMLVSYSCFAQSKVSKEEQGKMIQAIEKAVSTLRSMHCSFRQEKVIGLLNEKVVSVGTMDYCQPTKLRWQYNKPYIYTFVINGNKVMIKSSNQTNIIDARQSKVFKEVTRIMVNSITGKCLTDRKQFNVTMYDNNTEWIAIMVPMTKELKSMFKTIKLHIAPKKGLVNRVVLTEKSNDVTTIYLSDYKTNVKIDEKVFSVN